MKKNFMVFLLAIYIILLFFPTISFAGEVDTTPPQLISLEFDKEEVEAGDTITVTAKVTDDLSGVSSVYVYFEGNVGEQLPEIRLYKTEEDTYKGILRIGKYEEPRTLKVRAIEVFDNVGNFRWYEPDEDYSFTVINNGEVDTTPPQLISVEFDKIEVEAGDTITVTAKGTDDISGVSSIYVYFEGNTGQQLPGISLYKTDEEDTYKGVLRIGKYEEPGIRKLSRIEIQDNAGNWKSYTPDEDYSFTVINNGEVDVTPPQLVSLEFDKEEVEAGDTITVTAKVTDDVSGVSSVYVYFEGNTGQQLPGISLYKTNEEDTYKGILRIGKYEEPGIRKLTRIEMQDNAGNRKSYTPEEDYSFTVINNGEVDVTPPKLISLEIDKTEVEAGDIITITAKVTDDLSGVSSVEVFFVSEFKRSSSMISLYKTNVGDTYKGILTIGKYEEPRIQRINEIRMQDIAGNFEWYTLYEDYSFTVINNGEVDVTPPQLISLEIDKTEVEVGDTITVTAKVTDDVSGVSSIYVYFEGNTGQQLPGISLYKTDEADTYKGIVRIGKYEEPGIRKLARIEMQDNAGNWNSYNFNDEYSFLIINNGEVDVTPPQLISLEFEKTEVETGDTITVTAKVTDDVSGVSSVYVSFEGNTGQQLPGISLYKTDKADTYKGIVRIGKYEEPGIRKLTRIEMQDNAGNRKSYTPAENYIFNVINNGEVDTTPPKLISLEIDKTKVETGNTITITAKVTDDVSGVSSVYVSFEGNTGQQLPGIRLYKTDEEDTYKGILRIGKYEEPRTLRVETVHLSDNAGNWESYTPAEDYSFTIILQ